MINTHDAHRTDYQAMGYRIIANLEKPEEGGATQCKMEFSMAIYKWRCETHEIGGDEKGCLIGARNENRAAFERGAVAMRELIAADMSDELAEHIRALPLPEMTK